LWWNLGLLFFGIISHARSFSSLLDDLEGKALSIDGHANIRVKKMGEIDSRAFCKVCKKRLLEDADADFNAIVLYSKFQDYIKDS